MAQVPETYAPPNVGATAEALVHQLIRFGAAVVGGLVMLAGLWCCMRVFSGLFHAVTSPAEFQTRVADWATILGGETLKVKVQDQEIPLANVAAVGVLGLVALLLVWLSLGMLVAGAKIISLVTGRK